MIEFVRFLGQRFSQRLPWRVRNFAAKSDLALRYHLHRVRKGQANQAARPDVHVQFVCGFHGASGGPVAIATTANVLSQEFRVSFVTGPASHFNRLLSANVTVLGEATDDVDLYICDANLPHPVLDEFRTRGVPVIVTVHGFKDASHGKSQAQITGSLDRADLVHFVSNVQQDSFQRAPGTFRVIPNLSEPVLKRQFGRNIGAVGRMDDPLKGAAKTVAIGDASHAHAIHLWSSEGGEFASAKVVTHPHEFDKGRIYDSIDVLVFMSELETFGLVVIEAMSAGIPCVLSPLPAFAQFEDIPGVVIVKDGDVASAANEVNRLLDKLDTVRPHLIEAWQRRYSPDVIRSEWVECVDATIRAARSH